MREDPWVECPDYIINLTKTMIGDTNLLRLKNEHYRPSQRRILFLALENNVTQNVRKMNVETLGKIGAYGTHEGYNTLGGYIVWLKNKVMFLSYTGFKHIRPQGFETSRKSGRERSEDTAIATIICVACDIILQEQWQEALRTF